MFSILALAAAAVEVSPLLKSPVLLQHLLKPSDWPKGVARTGGADEVHIALTVSKEGTVTNCIVELSSGAPVLDETTCRLLTSRARFSPATFGDGSPAISVYRSAVWWEGWPDHSSRYGMTISLQRMPPGLLDPFSVPVVVSADETGRVDDCRQAEPQVAPRGTSRVAEAIASFIAASNDLARTACAQALKGMKVTVPRGSDGTPVRSVQKAAVIYTAIDKSPLPPGVAVIPPDFPPGVQMIRDSGIYVLRTPAGDMPLYTTFTDRVVTGNKRSTCLDTCARKWPPLVAPKDAQPIGKWTTIWRPTERIRQWAFEGKPVYTLARDISYGWATGDGEQGSWEVLRAPVDKRPAP